MPDEITPEQRAEWMNDLEALPDKLTAAVAGLDDQQLDTPYRPGGWTVRQVVHHFADSHANSYVRFRLALTEDKPTIKPYDEQLWAELPDAKSAPVGLSLSLLSSLHQALGASASLARRPGLCAHVRSPREWRDAARQNARALRVALPSSCGPHQQSASAHGLVIQGGELGVIQPVDVRFQREPSIADPLATIMEGTGIRPESTLIAAHTSTSNISETDNRPGQALAPAPSSESRAAKVIREIFESGRPLTYVRSTEEQRVAKILREVAARLAAPTPVTVWTWSLTEGLHKDGEAAEPGSQSPRVALDFIDAYKDSAIFHLKDFHEPLRESPEVRRRLRDLHQSCRDRWKFTVISSPVRGIPEELDRSLMFVELRLPDLVELVQFLREETRDMSDQNGGTSISEATLHQFGRALQGLTLEEARFALRRGLAVGKGLGNESLPALFEEKRLLVNRGGVIEYIAEGGSMAAVGGLPGLKKWLLERKKLFQMRDSKDDEIVPKGILIMGIPGCGKSLSIKATASYFELPLYRVDMSAVFSGQHGTPDAVFVDACKTMEDVAPAVLWFDEIETGMIAAADIGGSASPIIRVLPDLDAGKNPRPFRRRHRQPHRPAAGRTASQGTL